MERTYRVSALLKNFNELQRVAVEEPGDELDQVRMDILRALKNAPLTHEELTIIACLYLLDPIPPEREERAGRPSGGRTHIRVADLILEGEKSENARNIDISRKLKRACAKLADYLGDGYEA